MILVRSTLRIVNDKKLPNLQLLKYKIGHFGIQVDGGVVAIDTVISIGIVIGIKLFIGFDEGI